MQSKERWTLVEINRIQLTNALVGIGLPWFINQVSAETLLRCASLSAPPICIQTGDRYEVIANAQTFHLAIQAELRRLRIFVVNASEAGAFISHELVCNPVMNYLGKPVSIGNRYRLATKLGLEDQLASFGEAFQSQKKLAVALGRSKNAVFPSIKKKQLFRPSTQKVTNDHAAGDHISLSGSNDA